MPRFRGTTAVPGLQPILNDMITRIRNLEAVRWGLGTVKEITSNDGTLVVTDPSGPIVDLSVVPGLAQVEFLFTSDVVPPYVGTPFACTWANGGGGPPRTSLVDLTDPTYPKFLYTGAHIAFMTCSIDNFDANAPPSIGDFDFYGRGMVEQFFPYSTANGSTFARTTANIAVGDLVGCFPGPTPCGGMQFIVTNNNTLGSLSVTTETMLLRFHSSF
jgi:hypothetical protein